MPVPIIVPRLGWSMEEGTFTEWRKRDGEFVKRGDMLFVLEGDKAAQEIESFDEGILKIPADAPRPGDSVTVGQVLAFLLAVGESEQDVPQLGSETQSANERQPLPLAANDKQEGGLNDFGEKFSSQTPSASPRARRVARELGVDWTALTGTGKTGRIRERDVRAAATLVSPAQIHGELKGRIVPLSPLRRTIAERMVAASQQTAAVTLTTAVCAKNLVRHRDQLRGRSQVSGEPVPSFTDLIVHVVANVLSVHPMLQAQWRGDALFMPEEINIGIAVDTEAGLVVPVVRNVAALSLAQLTVATQHLIDRARTRKLGAEQMQGGTFTVTNLGMFGIDTFTPIINLPQCAILGVGRIVREQLSLSLTFDHRIVDGAPAARFLNDVRLLLEAEPKR